MVENKVVFKSRMKISTILLLTILFFIGFFFCSFVLVVRHKVNKRDFIFVNNDKSKYTSLKLGNGKIVSLRGIQHCVIISSDSMRLEIPHEDFENFMINTIGDTLYVKRKSSSMNRPPLQKVIFYLPTKTSIVADSCEIDLRGTLQSNQRHPSYEIMLHTSSLSASAAEYPAFFQDLSIAGSGNSGFRVSPRVHIDSLTLKDIQYVRLGNTWQFGKIHMLYDSSERLEMTKFPDSLVVARRR